MPYYFNKFVPSHNTTLPEVSTFFMFPPLCNLTDSSKSMTLLEMVEPLVTIFRSQLVIKRDFQIFYLSRLIILYKNLHYPDLQHCEACI